MLRPRAGLPRIGNRSARGGARRRGRRVGRGGALERGAPAVFPRQSGGRPGKCGASFGARGGSPLGSAAQGSGVFRVPPGGGEVSSCRSPTGLAPSRPVGAPARLRVTCRRGGGGQELSADQPGVLLRLDLSHTACPSAWGLPGARLWGSGTLGCCLAPSDGFSLPRGSPLDSHWPPFPLFSPPPRLQALGTVPSLLPLGTKCSACALVLRLAESRERAGEGGRSPCLGSLTCLPGEPRRHPSVTSSAGEVGPGNGSCPTAGPGVTLTRRRDNWAPGIGGGALRLVLPSQPPPPPPQRIPAAPLVKPSCLVPA